MFLHVVLFILKLHKMYTPHRAKKQYVLPRETSCTYVIRIAYDTTCAVAKSTGDGGRESRISRRAGSFQKMIFEIIIFCERVTDIRPMYLFRKAAVSSWIFVVAS